MSYDPQLLEEGAIDKDSSLLVNTFEAETPSVLPPPLPKVDIDCSHLLKAVTGRKLARLSRMLSQKHGLSTAGSDLIQLPSSTSAAELDIEAGTIVAGDTSARVASASGPSATGDIDFGRSLARLSQKHGLSTAGSDLIQVPSSTSAAELASSTSGLKRANLLEHLNRLIDEDASRKEMDETPSDDRDPKDYRLDLPRICRNILSRIVGDYRSSAEEQYIRVHLERSTERRIILDMDQLKEDAKAFVVETMKALIEAEMSNGITLDEYHDALGRRGLDAFQVAEDGLSLIPFCNHDLVRDRAKDVLEDLTPEDIIADALEEKVRARIEVQKVELPVKLPLSDDAALPPSHCLVCHDSIPFEMQCGCCPSPAFCSDECRRMVDSDATTLSVTTSPTVTDVIDQAGPTQTQIDQDLEDVDYAKIVSIETAEQDAAARSAVAAMAQTHVDQALEDVKLASVITAKQEAAGREARASLAPAAGPGATVVFFTPAADKDGNPAFEDAAAPVPPQSDPPFLPTYPTLALVSRPMLAIATPPSRPSWINRTTTTNPILTGPSTSRPNPTPVPSRLSHRLSLLPGSSPAFASLQLSFAFVRRQSPRRNQPMRIP